MSCHTNLSSDGELVGVVFSPDPTLFRERGELSLILRVVTVEGSAFLVRGEGLLLSLVLCFKSAICVYTAFV